MKRIFLTMVAALGALTLPFALSAQITAPEPPQTSKKSWRKAEDGFWERKNVLSVGIANISGNGFHYGFGPLTIAYDHRTRSGVTVGGMFQTARNFFNLTMDGYEVSDASLFALARVGYDIPVARRLRLRVGLGAGVGFHEVYDIHYGMTDAPLPPMPDLPHTETRAHLLADIHWVWRVGRNTELMFAPLIFSPSQIIFSPSGLVLSSRKNEYFPGGYYGFNIFPVRLGVRF